MAASPSASIPLSGTGAKLIDRTSAATRTTERMPPRLSTGSVRLVHVARHVHHGRHERDHGERQRDQEDRAPPELLEQRAGDDRPEGGDRAPDARPQRDRLRPARPGPQGRDQRERGRVGHARREPAEQARAEEHLLGRRPRREEGGRNRNRRADDQEELASVAIADRAEIEHRGGEAERVADCDQVERGLAGVELGGDRRQGDVRHRQVQVRDRGDEDERDEDETRAVRGFRA